MELKQHNTISYIDTPLCIKFCTCASLSFLQLLHGIAPEVFVCVCLCVYTISHHKKAFQKVELGRRGPKSSIGCQKVYKIDPWVTFFIFEIFATINVFTIKLKCYFLHFYSRQENSFQFFSLHLQNNFYVCVSGYGGTFVIKTRLLLVTNKKV